MGSDSNSDRARRIFAVTTDLLAVARELERDDDSERPHTAASSAFNFEPGDSVLAEIARQTYANRRKRAAAFNDTQLFTEPAWDILLDLYVAAHDRKKISVTSACIAASVPSTTALRWLTLLEREGFVVREQDRSDSRRTNVRLSSDAFAKMTEYFRSVTRPTLGGMDIDRDRSEGLTTRDR